MQVYKRSPFSLTQFILFVTTDINMIYKIASHFVSQLIVHLISWLVYNNGQLHMIGFPVAE